MTRISHKNYLLLFLKMKTLPSMLSHIWTPMHDHSHLYNYYFVHISSIGNRNFILYFASQGWTHILLLKIVRNKKCSHKYILRSFRYRYLIFRFCCNLLYILIALYQHLCILLSVPIHGRSKMQFLCTNLLMTVWLYYVTAGDMPLVEYVAVYIVQVPTIWSWNF